jgi:type IV secretory pathway TraG/TraD family ATPase VirD4
LSWSTLTHGTTGLVFAYAVTGMPMLVGLIQRRAPLRRLLRSPVIALLVTLAAVLSWTAIRSGLGMTGVPTQGAMANGFGTVFLLAFGYGAGLLIGGRHATGAHKRGTLLKNGHRSRIRIGEVRLAGMAVPALDETKHFKLIGTTGTGKSTAIRELLQSALNRGDRVIVADPDGGYERRFYDAAAGDVILNPFDERSRRWDLFAEVDRPFDAEQLARALIPDHDGPEKSWRAYARTLVTALIRQLWKLDGKDAALRDVRELYRLVSIASTEELRILVADTPAQPFLESGNERMFGSVRSVASTSLAALEHIAAQSASPFGVRQWVRGGTGRALYLPYRASQVSALRSTISAWMRLAIFEAMSGPERDQRLWFIVDELDALGAIDGLKDALARLRKFGGRCVLGFQSIAQVSTTYGQGEAQTLVENCGNTLILRCSASETGGTARFASRLIGDREIVRVHESRSHRNSEFATSTTVSEQHVTEAAVMASEIEQLPDLHGYLKLASAAEWRRVHLARPS